MVTWFSWLTMAGCLNQEAGGSLLKYTTQVKRKLSKLEILKTITTVLISQKSSEENLQFYREGVYWE